MTTRVAALLKKMERALQVREGELVPVILSFLYFFFLLCGYMVLRPLREAIAVLHGAQNVQYLFTGTFLTMLLLVPIFGALVARVPRHIFLPSVYLFFLANLLVFHALLTGEQPGEWTTFAFFVWISVFNMFVVAVFWSFMADIFTPAQGKRLFGVIAAGGSAGAIIGPALTAFLAPVIGTWNMTLVSASLLGLSLACLLRLMKWRTNTQTLEQAPKLIGGSAWAGATLLLRSPFLAGLAGMVILMTFLQSIMYVQQIDLVGQHYGERDPTRFFALVDTATNVVSVTLQLFVTGRLLRWLGAGKTLMIMPALTVVAFVALAIAPGIVMIGVIQVIRRAGEYGLMKPARDLLYTIVDDESKYKVKNFIDTFVYRGGDLASTWFYYALNSTLGMSLAMIAAVMAPVAAVWTVLSGNLGRSFEARVRQQDQ
jgi:AAA family ATP:ADP antiporter